MRSMVPSRLYHDTINTYLPRTFKGHGKGVSPLIFIPAEDFDLSDGATFNPGDTIISGSADQTARSWSCDTGTCLKVRN